MRHRMDKRRRRIGPAEVVRNERGIVVIIVMILIATLTLLAVAANRNMVTDIGIAANHLGSRQAFYAAEAGVEYGYNLLYQELQKLNPNTASITPPSISGYTIQSASYVSTVGTQTQRDATGNYEGLTAYIQRYRIAARATETKTNALGIVTLDVEGQLIPIFQFGIFYNNDLEMLPGRTMTFTGGRIHSNHDIYLNPDGGNTLSIDSKITTAGDVYHRRKDNPGGTINPVQIKDAGGTYRSMTIDSDSTNWATASQTTWGGTVKTEDHGIHSLNVPLPVGGQPIDILGTGSGSMYSKSGLRITNGVAKDKNNNTVELRYYDPNYKNLDGSLKVDPGGTASLNVNPLTTGTVYDYREARTMQTYDLNMDKLQHSSTAMAALNNPPTGGDPGILYISTSTGTNPAVRLTNGSSLPTSGLTVSTDNPLYVQGDYNTANAPAAIMSDAITILSNSWSNSYTSSTGISSRAASDTTVKAAIMSGNRDTAGSTYSGGVENFPRFLENWSNRNFNYAGSLVCLWQSQKVTRPWPGTGTVYNPPVRNWAYGIDPAHLPPGTPRVMNVQKLGWRLVTN